MPRNDQKHSTVSFTSFYQKSVQLSDHEQQNNILGIKTVRGF